MNIKEIKKIINKIYCLKDNLLSDCDVSKKNNHKNKCEVRDEILTELKVLTEQKDSELMQLKKIFNLGETELQILIITLAPRISLEYQKMIQYLHNDTEVKLPTIDLVLDMLAENDEDRIILEKCFSADANLFRSKLISQVKVGSSIGKLNTQLKVSERVYQYLIANSEISNELKGIVELTNQTKDLSDLKLDEDQKKRIKFLSENLSENRSEIIYLKGNCSAVKKESAAVIAAKIKKSVLSFNVKAALQSAGELTEIIAVAIREAKMQKALLYIEELETVFDNVVSETERKNFFSLLKEISAPVFVSSKLNLNLAEYINSVKHCEIEFKVPGFKLRKNIWSEELENSELKADEHLDEIAAMFKLNQTQVITAVNLLKNSITKNRTVSKIEKAGLLKVCHAVSNQNLISMAQKVESAFSWDNLVLPEDQKCQLHEVVMQVKYKHRVYDEWQLYNKNKLGKGVNVLFHGLSGTGKTMAAGIIATELGLDLYKIDLSTIVSKYIGETEKNLNRIFNEAETSNAILLFDEADALFGKRSEVQDAHDRYANIEVGYLLQRMDEYDGVVVLTSNFKNNMDSAFERRMHFIIEFPFPEAKERLKIWENILPNTVPQSEEIDHAYLAKAFSVSGGNIKNIAHAATFYAAANGGEVTMEYMIKAVKREYQKIGRACMQTEFGDYYKYIQ